MQLERIEAANMSPVTGRVAVAPAQAEVFLRNVQDRQAVLARTATWLVLRGRHAAKRLIAGPKVGVDATLVPVEATAARLQWHRWPQRIFLPGGINVGAIEPFAAALTALVEQGDGPLYVVVGENVLYGPGETYFQIAHGRVDGDAFVREEIVGDHGDVLSTIDDAVPKSLPSESYRRKVADLTLRDRQLYDAQQALRVSKGGQQVFKGVPNEWLARVIEAERDAIAREVIATFDDCGLEDTDEESQHE